jgi:hypothetical protein
MSSGQVSERVAIRGLLCPEKDRTYAMIEREWLHSRVCGESRESHFSLSLSLSLLRLTLSLFCLKHQVRSANGWRFVASSAQRRTGRTP